MGVLLGGFGKLQQGSHYRSLQKQLMGVQSQLRKAQRESANVQKMIDRYQKSANNSLTLQQYTMKNQFMMSAQASTGLAQFQAMDPNSMSADQKAAYQTAQTNYSQMMTNFDAQLQMQITQAKQQVEDQVQMMQDTMLEAAKDKEDSLGLQKDSLESQVQSAKADYDACKNMEKEDMQMFKPSYTGISQA